MAFIYFQVKEAYFEYFKNGLSPGEAIRYHENKFLSEEDYEGLANASINPTRRQVNHLHEIWTQSQFGSKFEPLEMLESKQDLYYSNGKLQNKFKFKFIKAILQFYSYITVMYSLSRKKKINK